MRTDKFYTNPSIARKYADELSARWPDKNVLFVEPSAGNGSFSKPLIKLSRKVRMCDICPGDSSIKKKDFLKTTSIFTGKHSAIVVIGNPPFGKNSSMAVKFFNHAAAYATEIAFILPKTFRKISIHKRLNLDFHLIKDEDVEKYAFYKDSKLCHVPCVWQIWSRRKEKRVLPKIKNVDNYITYVNKEYADFAMRRVGWYAGKIYVNKKEIKTLSNSTHYFIKEMKKGVMKKLSKTDWSDVFECVGSRSISKMEIGLKLMSIYNIKEDNVYNLL